MELRNQLYRALENEELILLIFTSSFWNFDALFQPQQHPARDSHDTFFLQGLSYLFVFNTFIIDVAFISLFL